MIHALASDGWRYVVDCAGSCGATVVACLEHVGTARCTLCGRVARGAAVDTGRSSVDGRLRLGQGGVSSPARVRRSSGAVSLRKTRVLSSMEVDASDLRLPAEVRRLVERVDGRVLLSVARRSDSPTTAGGKASANWLKTDVHLSVQWRGAGRTIIAYWKNGKRDCVMIGLRRLSHTEAGVIV